MSLLWLPLLCAFCCSTCAREQIEDGSQATRVPDLTNNMYSVRPSKTSHYSAEPPRMSSVYHLTTDSTSSGPVNMQAEETLLNRLTVLIPVVVLGTTLLIVVVVTILLFAYVARQRRRQSSYTIQPQRYQRSGGTRRSVSAYNPVAIDSEGRRYAMSTQDEFEASTIRRMSMRSSVFENRTPLTPSKPHITSVNSEIVATIGHQATLRLNFGGTPQPTVVWTFKGKPVGDDKSVELSADGSLVIICVEERHAGRYGVEISNNVGRAKGHINLTVQKSIDERRNIGENAHKNEHIRTNPVKREEYGEYVARMHALNNKGFINQFQMLPKCEEGKFYLVGRTGSNQSLNRFRNITAYDENRIVLKPMPGYSGIQNDYINASFVDGYSSPKMYIATQGPLPETIGDFWHMVWQEKVSTIAMVTNTVERFINKCEVYWPDGSEAVKKVGAFHITQTAQRVFADYTVRHLKLKHLGDSSPPWKVVQYHFTAWPDHGVPEYAGPILSFLKHIKEKHTDDKGPLLVHCSAGVGRTGTLIAIDIILTQAKTEGTIDVAAVVTKMREQRMKMVQTTDQYMLIHDAVLESLICGNTRVIASSFSKAMDQLYQVNKETGKSGYETQFEVLNQVSPKSSEVMCMVAQENQRKNRSDDFLPPDNWRVPLLKEIPNYINASFVNGYKIRNGFIIAQSPTADTIRDFWKMIYERKSSVIVMLLDLKEDSDETCSMYWPPQNSTCRYFKEYTVTTETEGHENSGFIERVISIVDTKCGEQHKVTQYQVGHWTAEGLNSQPDNILEVTERMNVVQRRTGNMPIVVHGSDTVSRSSVFCALVNAIEFCKTESVIDIFEIVKAIRTQKPGAIQTVEQYRFVYELMRQFLDEFSDYSNFK